MHSSGQRRSCGGSSTNSRGWRQQGVSGRSPAAQAHPHAPRQEAEQEARSAARHEYISFLSSCWRPGPRRAGPSEDTGAQRRAGVERWAGTRPPAGAVPNSSCGSLLDSDSSPDSFTEDQDSPSLHHTDPPLEGCHQEHPAAQTRHQEAVHQKQPPRPATREEAVTRATCTVARH
ncbi:hypothetical protein AAFF_G00344910 [Aldrovandia affinis]|uniref:Uncharacterized protein n=1 Tax=Aldrovandia affinis TaxID=143900 RepID=A0AAD7R5Q9_9TELE|nr:hypothetical protein AAFF_G00344910 [Aldrovandia affinis]